MLWDEVERGSGTDEIAARFVAAYGIPLETARHDIGAMVAQWRALDLLSDDQSSSPRDRVQIPAVVDWSLAPTPVWQENAVYTVRGKSFSLATELPRATATVRSFFRHLETPHAEPGLRLEVRQTAEGLPALLADGREQVRTLDEPQLIGGINQAVLEFLHPGIGWLAMMHGGAVMRDGGAVLLPAPSGSGKSTLIAHLIAQPKFAYLADDMIALAAPSGRAVPWPMPLSLKHGSWALVAAAYPELPAAPCQTTTRGPARLLVPPATAWETDPVPVRSIVFPRYLAGVAPGAIRLTAFQAIERLLADRIWLGYPMTEERVTEFLKWLDETPAYAVTYDALDDGRRLIESILR